MSDKVIKILGISASPRKAATHYSVETALDELDKYDRIEYEFNSLHKIDTYQCLHCDRCLREESRYCLVHEDEQLRELYDLFYEADGYLIGSPVYQMNYTGQLGCFFNLMRPSWNLLKNDRGYFWNKAGAALAVGGCRNGGQEMVLNSIHGFYHTNGITVVGGNFAYNGGSVWSKDEKAEGAAGDEEGLETVKAIADRLAAALYAFRGGKDEFEKAYDNIERKLNY